MSTTATHSDTKAARHFRPWNSPRRYIPRVWWDGHTWNLAVRDHYNHHHIRCAATWTDIMADANAWASVNAAHGLIPTTHNLAA